ncbi:MAG: branched-chain amino acid aminotransferase [Candidatus Sericytochromatia bacterium]
MQIDIRKTNNSILKTVDFDNLGFGHIFSDHMVSMDYENNVWGNPSIIPFEKISFYPSLATLHYGQAVFEGMKAFTGVDGKHRLFRPEKHHKRLNTSHKRICIPEVSYDVFIKSLETLLEVDLEWIPKKRGNSLYIRPFTFATEEFLGLKVSDTFKYMVITCPVGAYYKGGLNPISLITSGDYVRAVKGGLGEAKTPANYAASLYPSMLAKEQGYTQVIWLDGIERKYIDEIGTSNIFFFIDDELITPPLDGTILDGVTRDSVINLAKNMGIKVNERRISIDEVLEASAKGKLKDAFGSGTAAIISPIGKIRHQDKEIIINNNENGELAKKIYKEITDIQYGEKEDIFNWCHVL